MQIELRDSPAGKAALGPVLQLSREQRSQLFDSLVKAYCKSRRRSSSSATSASRSHPAPGSSPSRSVGWKPPAPISSWATRSGTASFRPHRPAVSPRRRHGHALDATVGGLASCPRRHPARRRRPSRRRRAGPLEEVCQSIHPNHEGCSRGAGTLAGVVGLFATLGVAGADLFRQRRRLDLGARSDMHRHRATPGRPCSPTVPSLPRSSSSAGDRLRLAGHPRPRGAGRFDPGTPCRGNDADHRPGRSRHRCSSHAGRGDRRRRRRSRHGRRDEPERTGDRRSGTVHRPHHAGARRPVLTAMPGVLRRQRRQPPAPASPATRSWSACARLEGPTAGEIFADISGEHVEDSPQAYVDTLNALGRVLLDPVPVLRPARCASRSSRARATARPSCSAAAGRRPWPTRSGRASSARSPISAPSRCRTPTPSPARASSASARRTLADAGSPSAARTRGACSPTARW